MSNMLPPALLASLGRAGGAPAGPPPGAGPNPLAALLGGAGPGAPPPAGGPSGGGGGDQSKPIDILKQMIDLGKQYVEVEPDEQDKATMTKVLSTLQGYLAQDQKENDQMLGGAMSPRAVRKLGGPQGA